MTDRITEIINIYKRYYKQKPDTCIAHVKKQKSLVDAIRAACKSRDANNLKHGHQYRIPNETLDQWSDAVTQVIHQIKGVKTFEDILAILEKARIDGIGQLAIYDTATRIGAYKNVYPSKVYLHAGTRTGAKNLLRKPLKQFVEKKELPEPFQRKDLACWEIEDILCIFKDEFDKDLSVRQFQLKCMKKVDQWKHC